MGYRVAVHHRVMLLLVAATIVASFQTVGALLVFGMLLAPAGTGALVTRRVGSMMAVAAVVGVLATYLGLLASYHFAWAASAAVVVVAVGIFFVVFAVNGIVTRGRR
jgi:ABC-type Mn2+/Zn2+ transport system permease subunit